MDGSTGAEDGTSPTRPSFGQNGADGFYDNQNGIHYHHQEGPETERGRPQRTSQFTGGADNNQSHGRFPRISRPVELMRPSYDVIVIGSGYGGGVAASRMARGKQHVCVLERGNERWPGEFPGKLQDALKELHISGEFAPGDRRSVSGHLVDKGDPNGLYHFVVGEGQNVYMGNGLGGTSLLNANVFLEAHPKVLDMEIWPQELKGKDAWRKCE